jgi:hypothetical protein
MGGGVKADDLQSKKTRLSNCTANRMLIGIRRLWKRRLKPR